MKRCPECRRDYYDDSLLYCLEDGTALVQGSVPSPDDPQTAILHETAAPNEAATRAQVHLTDAEGRTSLFGQEAVTAPAARRSPMRIVLALGAVLAILTAGFFANRYYGGSSSSQISSIAVLPFQDRGGNAESEYLSDGLAESLIYRLTQLPDLKVSPASSVMRYKGKEFDAKTIATELGVQAVMSGRIIQRGDSLSISVELIDAANNKTIWGEQYEKRMSDLLATQREIAATIVEKLQLKISGTDATGITKKYTDSNEAYQLYLKGRFQWNKRTIDGLKAAEVHFRQAIAQDPSFALAHSALAETYVLFPNYGVESPRETGPKAKTAATKAIELDPTLAEPHAALSLYHTNYTWDIEAGEREVRRAIELNPKYATAYHWLGTVLPILGKCDEAIAVARRAEELDPLSAIISADVAYNLILCRRYDDALLQAAKTLKLDPNFYYIHYVAGWAYSMKGEHAAALAAFRRSRELNNDPFATALYAQALAKAGERAQALKLRDELRASAERQYIDPVWLALPEIGLGDKDAAFALLERTLTERGVYAAFMPEDPAVDDLRGDPRFEVLMRKIRASRLE